MRKRQQKPFFYFEELTDRDKVPILIYTLFTIVLMFLLIFGDNKLRADSLFFYIILPQLIFIFFLYVSLRNFKVYLIWFSFSLLHVVIFIFSKMYDQLLAPYAHFAIGANTVLLLLLFQGLRCVSLKVQHREFVNPAKSMNGKDLVENRKVSTTDYFLSLLYFASFLGLSILAARL